MKQRIPEKYATQRADIEAAALIVSRLEEKAKAVRADAHLSEAGRWDALRKELAGGARSHLAQLQKNNLAALASIAAQKKALLPAVKDRTDTIGEMRRAELRAFLRGLPQGERTKMALSGDPAMIEALVDQPAVLSGLSEELRAQAVDVYVAKTHGETAARIEADQEALENVRVALHLAKIDLERISGAPVVLEAAE
ncbi:hypothetical protein [Methylocystis echinoides]|nr:hypothetical protein [Methylocystis echinoides]